RPVVCTKFTAAPLLVRRKTTGKETKSNCRFPNLNGCQSLKIVPKQLKGVGASLRSPAEHGPQKERKSEKSMLTVTPVIHSSGLAANTFAPASRFPSGSPRVVLDILLC